MATRATALGKLRNRFFVIRHGQAESNIKRIFVSQPEVARNEYGLTETGRKQASKAADTFKSILSSEPSVCERLLIVSSDFKRAKETAEILHACLGTVTPIRFETRLRERAFGTLHFKNVDDFVKKVWDLDEADPTHNEFGVESVMEMVVRLSHLIQELNKEHSNRVIILVSHGDPCQCIHTVFKGINPNEFRKQPNGYANCEIRELQE